MLKKQFLLALFILLSFSHHSFSQQRTLSMTIDDLPFVGESKNFHLAMIIDAIKTSAIPATGFIIAREVNASNLPTLQKFREAGLSLGNHTLSHINLNKVTADIYIQDIDTADKILTPVLTEPKFFRYPYLAHGNGFKKERVQHYLSTKNYHVAPITIDSKDFIFNQLLLSVPESERRHFLTVLKPCYLDFIWQQTLKAEEHSRASKNPEQTQILLIHANLLNAYVLPDLINLYKQNGFNFVSLADALKTTRDNDKSEPTHETPKGTPTAIEAFFAWN